MLEVLEAVAWFVTVRGCAVDILAHTAHTSFIPIHSQTI